MKIFNLPDLGEGLAEAEIREWHVKVGDIVKVDQPLVCMETAKAVVEVPSPNAGRIYKLYGKAGDIIQTHAPLIEFESESEGKGASTKDQGTVVGSLEESSEILNEETMIVGTTQEKTATIKAMPAVRALAKQLNVDLSTITGSGTNGQITADDVKKAKSNTQSSSGQVEPLQGVRRAMAATMTQSHQAISPATLMDDADITDLGANADFTVALLQAMVVAAKAEPALNVWYDDKNKERCLHPEINIGLAIDTEEGLFVPVLKNVASKTAQALRKNIDEFKKSVRNRSIAPSDLQGATITLSNLGTIAGRYASPVIVPPMVAILCCGKRRDEVCVRDAKMVIRHMAPLSLTFDHRVVTGGEAARFLNVIIQQLEKV